MKKLPTDDNIITTEIEFDGTGGVGELLEYKTGQTRYGTINHKAGKVVINWRYKRVGHKFNKNNLITYEYSGDDIK